jgi:sensor histidine kinase YesM
MDIYLFGFIIVAFGSLVVTVLVMYSHSHKLQSTIVDLEDDLESADFFTVDVLRHKLQLSKQARELQQKQIKELQEELIELENQLKTINI